VYTVYVTKYLYQILSLTLRVNICIAFAKKYVTNIRKRYRPHKEYIFLIGITSRVDLAMSVCPASRVDLAMSVCPFVRMSAEISETIKARKLGCDK